MACNLISNSSLFSFFSTASVVSDAVSEQFLVPLPFFSFFCASQCYFQLLQRFRLVRDTTRIFFFFYCVESHNIVIGVNHTASAVVLFFISLIFHSLWWNLPHNITWTVNDIYGTKIQEIQVKYLPQDLSQNVHWSKMYKYIYNKFPVWRKTSFSFITWIMTEHGNVTPALINLQFFSK